MFWDLHVQAEPERAGEMAKKLGLKGIGIAVPWDERAKIPELARRAKSVSRADVALGIELQGGPNEIQKLAKSVRRQHELILVRGGTEEINRAALETPEVDILVNPNLGNGECGINHILARLGAKNRVAVCFELREIIQSYKKTRSQLLTSYLETARFVRKYKCPFVLSAGAASEWDMRSPSELIAFGKFLGFRENECRRALSGEIVKENRKRLSGKWIMPGVEME